MVEYLLLAITAVKSQEQNRHKVRYNIVNESAQSLFAGIIGYVGIKPKYRTGKLKGLAVFELVLWNPSVFILTLA